MVVAASALAEIEETTKSSADGSDTGKNERAIYEKKYCKKHELC